MCIQLWPLVTQPSCWSCCLISSSLCSSHIFLRGRIQSLLSAQLCNWALFSWVQRQTSSFSLSREIALIVSFLFLSHCFSPFFSVLTTLCSHIVPCSGPCCPFPLHSPCQATSRRPPHTRQAAQTVPDVLAFPLGCSAGPRGHMLGGYQAHKDRACVTWLIKGVLLFRSSTITSPFPCGLVRGVYQ